MYDYRLQKLAQKKLDAEHIAYLTNQDTLIKWAGFALHTRAKLFHR